ncbi:MAG: adenylosuccinate synthetase, partial [Pseudanabaena sp. ELA748]
QAPAGRSGVWGYHGPETALRLARHGSGPTCVRVSGITGIALTKLDVLTGIEKLKICIGYRTEKEEFTESVPVNLRVMARCVPVYEELDGWTEDIRKAKRVEELPRNTRRYIERLETLAGVRLVLVSVGPDRDETINLADPFAD